MEQQIKLPDDFVERMRNMLQTEYEDFAQSYEKERYYGLRENLLKQNETDFADRMPFSLTKVSWAKEGYYYNPDEQPGKHVLHEAGAYYIQEPSAMSVVEALDPQPGELILDLCAAPGGKSTQIAARMSGKGLLVANEIVPNRAKILSQNIERLGIRNSVVLNETPDRMAIFFPGFFDKIVVDAPCSGEGMFRKEEIAVSEWSLEHVKMCAERQDMILEEAVKMLKPGGVLVYSTCTFAPAENEGTVSRILQKHPDLSLVELPNAKYFEPGRSEWCDAQTSNIEYTARLWPNKLNGEGHFLAKIVKAGSGLAADVTLEHFVSACTAATQVNESKINSKNRKEGKNVNKSSGKNGGTSQIESQLRTFLVEELGLSDEWLSQTESSVELFGEQIYLVPKLMKNLKGIKVERAGLHVATIKKNRLEPAHALALSLRPDEPDAKHCLQITIEEANKYIRGEGITCNSDYKGWMLLVYEGYPIGIGKAVNGQIKNHYPKGLRKP